MEESKCIVKGVEIDTDLANRIKNEILYCERVNARTKELSEPKMVEKALKILEDKVNAY